MPFVQRNNVGEIVGQFANCQIGYAEEWLADDSPELSHVSLAQLASAERIWRDSELLAVKWLRERHRDQLEIELEPTLSSEQFRELLLHMQALRDWPQSPEFPDSLYRPAPPSWIAQQTA